MTWYEASEGELVRVQLRSGVVRHETVVLASGFYVITERGGVQYARWPWEVSARKVEEETKR